MQFQAYASASSPRKPSNALWRVQNMVHKGDSVVLPGALLLCSCLFVIYEHLSLGEYGRTTVRNFLFLILLSMLPLGFLETKILSCADPVGTISKFSGKVLMMHASFLALRLLSAYLNSSSNLYALLGFIVAAALLPLYFGFTSTRIIFREHSDVWCILGMAVLGAVITEGCAAYDSGFLKVYARGYRLGALMRSMVDSAELYIELLAFVPAMWRVCRPNGGAQQTDVAETRQRAVAFFAFTVAFYFTEDVFSAISLGGEMRLAALGHIAHFLLLVDFAGFVLSHLFDEDKLNKIMGSLTSWLADACSV
jgi:hypothetical protein